MGLWSDHLCTLIESGERKVGPHAAGAVMKPKKPRYKGELGKPIYA